MEYIRLGKSGISVSRLCIGSLTVSPVQANLPPERAAEIARLEKAMKEAAKMLEFELAADLRDQIIRLRGEK